MEVTFELPLMAGQTRQDTGELVLELNVHPVVTSLDELTAADAPEVARVNYRRGEWVIRHSVRHGYMLQLDHLISESNVVKFAGDEESTPFSFCEPQFILAKLTPVELKERFWRAWHAKDHKTLPRYSQRPHNNEDRSSIALQMLHLLNEARRFKVVDGRLCLSIQEPHLSVTVRPDIVAGFGFSLEAGDVAKYRLNEYAQAKEMLEKAKQADHDYFAEDGDTPRNYRNRATPVIWLSADYPNGDLRNVRAAGAAIRLKRMIGKYLDGRNLEEVANAWAIFDNESQELLIELVAIPDAQLGKCLDPHIQNLARRILAIPANPLVEGVIAYDPFLGLMIDTARAELLGG